MTARLNVLASFLATLLVLAGNPPQGQGSSSGGGAGGVTSASSTAPTQVWIAATKALSQAECNGQVYVNDAATAAVAFTLVDAPEVGSCATFLVTDNSGVYVYANSGDTIATGVQTTAAGSYLYSTRIGSKLTVMRKSATEWVAEATGTWGNGSTTSAGFAYTPLPWTSVTPATHTWDADPDVTETCTMRQVGSVCYFQQVITLTGAPATAQLWLTSFPGGVTPNESAMGWDGASLDYLALESSGSAVDTSANTVDIVTAALNGAGSASDGNIYLFTDGSGGLLHATITQAAPWAWATGDRVVVRFAYPAD